jgi:hypothetical protein
MGVCKNIGFIIILNLLFIKTEAQTAMSMITRDWQKTQQLIDTTLNDQSNNIQTGSIDRSAGVYLLKKTNQRFQLYLLPIGFTVQSNSHHPSGINDGSMIPAAGLQTQVTTGFKLKSGNFSIQLQPEFVYAANPDFEGFPLYHYNFSWNSYYKYLNQSDIPEQFGSGIYQKVFAGQSNIKYSTQHWELGVSTENLWWGPGRRNSMIMSYNAPGFLHVSFNSVKSLKTKIGSFEWQLIGGQLTNSGIIPPQPNLVYDGHFVYQPKREENRYITGAVINWQPKWIPRLYLGTTRVTYLYPSDAKSVVDFLPIDGIVRTSAAKSGHKATLGSLFARYIMPSELAEVYFEYGRGDKAPDIFNSLVDKNYPKGFIFGLRKLFPLNPKGTFIQFATEITQLQLDDAKLLLDTTSTSWYTHPYVRHGFTNLGQSVGAGIGPGSNSQSLEISWLKGFNKIGLVFERVVRNNDFYYYNYQQSGDYNRHWIDLSTELMVQWQFKKIQISADAGIIRSINYEWFSMPPDQNPGSYFRGGWDLLNFHSQISIRYLLK